MTKELQSTRLEFFAPGATEFVLQFQGFGVMGRFFSGMTPEHAIIELERMMHGIERLAACRTNAS